VGSGRPPSLPEFAFLQVSIMDEFIRCIVSDIDGTLADVEHRRHFVEGKKKDWDAFFAAMVDDPPKGKVICAYHGLCTSLNMRGVLMTGRFEKDREKTEKWLADNFVSYGLLFMRGNGDQRPDEIVKAEMLYELQYVHHMDPYLILDDRNKVVDMWRAAGYTCLQVAPGDF